MDRSLAVVEEGDMLVFCPIFHILRYDVSLSGCDRQLPLEMCMKNSSTPEHFVYLFIKLF